MTISTRVQEQLFEMKAAAAAHAAATAESNPGVDSDALQLIRLAPTSSKEGGVIVATSSTSKVVRTWTRSEHERFLAGLELFPHGPWKQIADHVGTKTTRQTMAHAQKYRQKIARRRNQLLLQQHQQQQAVQLHQLHQRQQPTEAQLQQIQHQQNQNANEQLAPLRIHDIKREDDEEDEGDDGEDARSTTSEESESAAAAVEARMADAMCDGGGDEFFETEILPLLRQLEPMPTPPTSSDPFAMMFLNSAFPAMADDDVLMADAFEMAPHFPPTSTFF